MSSEPASAPTTNPIADLPSGEPIPHSTPPPPASPPKKTLPLPLRALHPASIDGFLAHLNNCLSTPSGIDTVLQFICYTSSLSSAILTSVATRSLHRSAARWIALISASRATVLLASSPPTTATAALLLAQRLKSLSSLLTETRTMTRLWGLLGMYFWAKRLATSTLSKSAPSPLSTAVALFQLSTCVAFQALENGAYLASKGVLGWPPARQAWAFKWSARLWGAYVGAELGKLAAQGLERRRRAQAGEKEGAVEATEEETRWRKALATNLAWAPLTIHWGSDNGLVSDWVVGALACVPATIQMRELWAKTA